MKDLIPLTEHGPVDGKNYSFDWEGEFLNAHLLSDVGKKREKNEDSCIICAPDDQDLAESHGILFAVADGMGGASAGEYASRLALHMLVESYYAGAKERAPVALREAIANANEELFQEAEQDLAYAGMGTTVSALVVLGNWAYVAQVGDSRVYLLRERSGIHQITRDHSLVAEQLRSGLISEEEARNHSLKNLITRAVGIKEVVQVDSFAFQLRRGDTLLICSDGLCGLVEDHELAESLSRGDLKKATEALIDSALDAGGTDNITALTIRVSGAPTTTEYQEGAEQIEIPTASFLQRMKGWIL